MTQAHEHPSASTPPGRVFVGRKVELAELTAALEHALGGRRRLVLLVGEPGDRARKPVTSRIRETIARITTEHPALGLHLENAIRTGVFCSYVPERSPDWNC